MERLDGRMVGVEARRQIQMAWEGNGGGEGKDAN